MPYRPRMGARPALAAILFLVAACGSAQGTTTTAAGVEATSTTSAPGGGGSPEAPAVEGPPAPDFTLVLGSGGTFTLSDEQKPVYMVFWAEW